jgi:hypothetical protein
MIGAQKRLLILHSNELHTYIVAGSLTVSASVKEKDCDACMIF